MQLSKSLTEEFGRGFSKSNLEYMRRFFVEYKNEFTEISQKASGESDYLRSPVAIAQTLSGQLRLPNLSWSHYVFLMGINNRD
ncbi:DUF1016 N-terminal domain-containing protein [Methanoplanus limicola]|uniref:DUF1016 N-terminal domain-containing protein n=1 Tax=Methanoplanus limicola TaxID=2315 RepID=UPI00373AE36D